MVVVFNVNGCPEKPVLVGYANLVLSRSVNLKFTGGVKTTFYLHGSPIRVLYTINTYIN